MRSGSTRRLATQWCGTRACPQTWWRSTLWAMTSSDLTDTPWRRLHPLLPSQKPFIGQLGKDHRTILNGILWRDAIGMRSLSATARGRRFLRASIAGPELASGTVSWLRCSNRRMPRVGSADHSNLWIAWWCECINTRRERKGGPGNRGARSKPWWLRHEEASPLRARQQADGAGAAKR